MEIAREHLADLIIGAEVAYTRLEASLADLDESAVREASLLPGWSRGHVLTHLARNADSHVRLLAAVAEGRLVEQYVGGAEGRAADIEAGATRSAAALLEDLASSQRRLIDVWRDLSDEVWDRSVNSNLGMRPAWRLVWSRWRELDIHHVDLDLGYRPAHWPDDFTALMFRNAARDLEARLPGNISVKITATDRSLGWAAKKGTPSTGVVVSGPAFSLVAWLLGRDAVATDVEAHSQDGQPSALPPLARWA